MGYSHYWYWNPALASEPERFKLLTCDTKKMLEYFSVYCAQTGYDRGSPVKIRNGNRKGNPVVTDTEIEFNGAGALAHEPFLLNLADFANPNYAAAIPLDAFFYMYQSCKTNGKPYDLLVTAVLLRFVHYFPDLVRVRSDGSRVDWEQAAAFCRALFGVGVIPDTIRA